MKLGLRLQTTVNYSEFNFGAIAGALPNMEVGWSERRGYLTVYVPPLFTRSTTVCSICTIKLSIRSAEEIIAV